MPKKLTQKEYLKSSQRCPVCLSEDVEAESGLVLDVNNTLQRMDCNSCNSAWNEKYKLVGYELLY